MLKDFVSAKERMAIAHCACEKLAKFMYAIAIAVLVTITFYEVK